MWNSPSSFEVTIFLQALPGLSCWQLETPDTAPGHRNGPAGASVFILFWGPWEVKAFQGAGLVAWGSEYRTEDTLDVANFDYWKELLQSQQLVKEVSSGETGHCFCQDQDPTPTELCFLYSGCKAMRTRVKVLTASHALAVGDCLTLSLIQGESVYLDHKGKSIFLV